MATNQQVYFNYIASYIEKWVTIYDDIFNKFHEIGDYSDQNIINFSRIQNQFINSRNIQFDKELNVIIKYIENNKIDINFQSLTHDNNTILMYACEIYTRSFNEDILNFSITEQIPNIFWYAENKVLKNVIIYLLTKFLEININLQNNSGNTLLFICLSNTTFFNFSEDAPDLFLYEISVYIINNFKIIINIFNNEGNNLLQFIFKNRSELYKDLFEVLYRKFNSKLNSLVNMRNLEDKVLLSCVLYGENSYYFTIMDKFESIINFKKLSNTDISHAYEFLRDDEITHFITKLKSKNYSKRKLLDILNEYASLGISSNQNLANLRLLINS